MSFYTVKTLLTTWTAVSPTRYPKFESALEKALSSKIQYDRLTVWEYEETGSGSVGRIVWDSEFGGINEFAKYGKLSAKYQRLFDHFEVSLKNNHYPRHEELSQVSGIPQHRIYSALAKLAWAGYLEKVGTKYQLVKQVCNA